MARATPRLGDGQPLPEPYRLRSLPAQNEVAEALGGSVTATASVDAALAWLAAAQEDDGSWDPSSLGRRPRTQSGRPRPGRCRRGCGYGHHRAGDSGVPRKRPDAPRGHVSQERPARTGVSPAESRVGRQPVGPARLYAKMYCHGMASLALSEALAMTGDVRIRPHVERAVEFTVSAQHSISGGWRYQPGDQGDMSQFGWQVMALKSASLAGIPIPQKTREGMLHFLQRCEHGLHGGLAGYKPGSTAFAGHDRRSPGLPLLPRPGTRSNAGHRSLRLSVGGTAAARSAQRVLLVLRHAGAVPGPGEAWTKWNAALQRQLLPLQRTDGPLAGSWDPDTVWGSYGGRVYTTAMAALSLEVYYRYLPLTATSRRHANGRERPRAVAGLTAAGWSVELGQLGEDRSKCNGRSRRRPSGPPTRFRHPIAHPPARVSLLPFLPCARAMRCLVFWGWAP